MPGEKRANWAIIVHGVADEIEPEKEVPDRAGCRAALNAGSATLARGGSVVEAVGASARVLEGHPTSALRSAPSQAPQVAIEAPLFGMDAVGGDAGVIAINRQGRIGWSHRGTHLAVAFAAVGMDGPAVWLSKDYQRPAANGESLRRSSEQGQ